MPPLSHLTSCTPTESNLYLVYSLATVVSERDLCGLLIFHIPHLVPLFCCLNCTKGSVQGRGMCIRFITRPVFGEGLLAPHPTPNLEVHPFLAVCDCLFIKFAATLHIWRLFPPAATWGRAMEWWQGTTYHGVIWYKCFESRCLYLTAVFAALHSCKARQNTVLTVVMYVTWAEWLPLTYFVPEKWKSEIKKGCCYLFVTLYHGMSSL